MLQPASWNANAPIAVAASQSNSTARVGEIPSRTN
jgi:hypothetical protein